MFNPVTKEIYVTRGDNWEHNLSMEDSAGLLPFGVGDSVKMTVRKRWESAEKVIEKTITEFVSGYAVLTILPADTAGKPFGDYVYDVETTTAHFGVLTVLKGTFIIGEEASY